MLENLINVNPSFETIIGSTIVEYDIRNAGATAIRKIKGEKVYDRLMCLSKPERVIQIGLMMRDEPLLAKQVSQLMLDWLNTFIDKNKIKQSNIISTTRDSIIIHKKIPTRLMFADGVEFRNKDGIFSSYYRTGRLTVFFDSMRDEILVKGLRKDFDANRSPFFSKFLCKYLHQIESMFSKTDSDIFVLLKTMREKYLYSHDLSIYKDIMHKDQIGIRFLSKPEDIVYLEDGDGILEDENDEYVIAKELNYMNVLMPLMRSVQIIF